MNKRILILLGCLLALHLVSAQNLKQLKNKRTKNQKELAYTNKILKSVKLKKNSSLEKLYLLQKNIKKRSEIVNLYEKEIQSYLKKEQSATSKINILNEKQIQLKNIYAQLLYQSYFEGMAENKWLYVFSANSFSQAYNRYKYYEQFTNHISEQLKNINAFQDSIATERNNLTLLVTEKEQLKKQKKEEQDRLQKQRKKQSSEISKLKAREKDLLSRLRLQKRREKKLAVQIQKVIRQNAKKSQRNKLTKKDILLGNSFASNKRKLPWPVKGVIFSTFGEHPHPILKKVKIRNDGIDIATQKGAVCKSIFKGEVSRIFSIPGLNSTVIIKHGNYLSVYANLSHIRVKKGEQIATGQALGSIATTPNNGTTILKLQIWKGTSCQNPILWLQKK